MNILRLIFKREKEKKRFESFKLIQTISGDYNSFYNKIISTSTIILITGKRGSGKTALGMKLLEIYSHYGKKCYALGFKNSKLPTWIKKVDNLEKVKNNSVLLVDEGGILFSSRESMKSSNKWLSNIMAIARHKNLNLILITQNSGMIDLNVLRLTDTILMKEPSFFNPLLREKP
jgi:Cdc6-like AAA superfamily ATPase